MRGATLVRQIPFNTQLSETQSNIHGMASIGASGSLGEFRNQQPLCFEYGHLSLTFRCVVGILDSSPPRKFYHGNVHVGIEVRRNPRLNETSRNTCDTYLLRYLLMVGPREAEGGKVRAPASSQTVTIKRLSRWKASGNG